MKKLSLIAVALILSVSTSHAEVSKRLEKDLKSLLPGDRLEQLCDLRAMEDVGKDKTGKKHDPDRAVAYGSRSPTIDGDTLHVDGGALRSHGRWHKLSYNCTATPDHMKVLHFDYILGPYIPKSEWEENGLF